MRRNMEAIRPEQRKWHFSKEISLPFVWSMLIVVGGGLMGYQQLSDKVDTNGKTTVQLTDALKDTNAELRALTKEFQSGAGPSAQNALRIQNVEAAQVETRNRIADIERSAAAREARLLRLEVSVGTTNARVRAQGER